MANIIDTFLKIKCEINGKIEDAYFLEDEDIFRVFKEYMSYDTPPHFIDKENFIMKIYGRWSYSFFLTFDENSGLNILLDEIKEKNINIKKLYFIFYEVDFMQPASGIFVKEIDIENQKITEYYENVNYDIFFYYPKLNKKNQKEICISFYKKNYLLFSKNCDEKKYFEFCENNDFDWYYEKLFILKFIYEKYLIFSKEIEKIIEMEDKILKENEIKKAIELTVKSIKNYFNLFEIISKRKEKKIATNDFFSK